MVKVKRALGFLRQGICTVYVKIEKTDALTKRTVFEEKMLYENIPCHLSVENVSAAAETGQAAIVSQAAALFLEPELDIPAGSKVVVTQFGRTAEYKRSGEPVIYSGHQEIPLELWGHA